MTRVLLSALLACALAACGSSQSSSAAPGVTASEANLSHRSGIACRADNECGVCYRRETCGEAIAASDPRGQAEECHVSPSAFCMPRRAHCDEGHCVAR